MAIKGGEVQEKMGFRKIERKGLENNKREKVYQENMSKSFQSFSSYLLQQENMSQAPGQN